MNVHLRLVLEQLLDTMNEAIAMAGGEDRRRLIQAQSLLHQTYLRMLGA